MFPPMFVWVLSRLPASPHSSKSCICGEKLTDFKLTLDENASVNGCLYDWMEVKDACILGQGSSTPFYKAHYLAGFSVLPSFQMGKLGPGESRSLPAWTETPAGLKACRTGLKTTFLGSTAVSCTVPYPHFLRLNFIWIIEYRPREFDEWMGCVFSVSFQY